MNGDPRPDGGTIALDSNQMKCNAVVAVAGLIDQQRRCLPDIEHQNVHVAVVIEIYETSAPLYIAITWLTEFRWPGHIREGASAEVPVEVIDLVGVVRDEQVELAVVVVVGEIHSHRSEFLAIPAEGHACQHTDLIEGAVVS